MRIENWNGYNIRFIEHKGEWWAVLKDICDALGLKSFKVAQRLDPSTIQKIRIDASDIPARNVTSRARKSQDMIVKLIIVILVNLKYIKRNKK